MSTHLPYTTDPYVSAAQHWLDILNAIVPTGISILPFYLLFMGVFAGLAALGLLLIYRISKNLFS